jgi:catechol 2,3-dioxygenase-like lactoylglutathione lyase family enzyme
LETIRAATLTVSDLARSQTLYTRWLDYQAVENGTVSDSLAQGWGTPEVAGAPYSILQPQSGAPVYLRLIEQPAQPDYRPLRSYGWAAIEINNQDTLQVAARMEDSPFKIIGPPKEIPGLDAIFAMQMQGPDQEIVYLTQIRSDMADYDLPRAKSLIDRLFILVLACSDMEKTGEWAQSHLGFEKGRSMEIPYTMISKAFEQPMDTLHALATLKHDRDVALEIDQYPEEAVARRTHEGWLPPCAAIGSFLSPDWERAVSLNKATPVLHDSIIYGGKPAFTLRDPDGALFEMIKP